MANVLKNRSARNQTARLSKENLYQIHGKDALGEILSSSKNQTEIVERMRTTTRDRVDIHTNMGLANLDLWQEEPVLLETSILHAIKSHHAVSQLSLLIVEGSVIPQKVPFRKRITDTSKVELCKAISRRVLEDNKAVGFSLRMNADKGEYELEILHTTEKEDRDQLIAEGLLAFDEIERLTNVMRTKQEPTEEEIQEFHDVTSALEEESRLNPNFIVHWKPR